jgi:hypothetical protein
LPPARKKKLEENSGLDPLTLPVVYVGTILYN